MGPPRGATLGPDSGVGFDVRRDYAISPPCVPFTKLLGIPRCTISLMPYFQRYPKMLACFSMVIRPFIYVQLAQPIYCFQIPALERQYTHPQVKIGLNIPLTLSEMVCRFDACTSLHGLELTYYIFVMKIRKHKTQVSSFKHFPLTDDELILVSQASSKQLYIFISICPPECRWLSWVDQWHS